MKPQISNNLLAIFLFAALITACDNVKQGRGPDPNCQAVATACQQNVRQLIVDLTGNLASYAGTTNTYTIGDASGSTILFTVNHVNSPSDPQVLAPLALNSLVDGNTYTLWISDPSVKCTFVANFGGCTNPIPLDTLCCKPYLNILKNGDFESGDVGFTSDYGSVTSFMANAVLPANYGVLNGNQAATVNPNWDIMGFVGCPPPSNNKFLLVNGRTGQTTPGFATIWEKSVTINTNTYYDFCMRVKNLPPCAFGMDPKMRVVFDNGVGLYQVLDINTVATGADACDWQQVKTQIQVPPVTGTNLNIQVQLFETMLADGNDVAIDDIIFNEPGNTGATCTDPLVFPASFPACLPVDLNCMDEMSSGLPSCVSPPSKSLWYQFTVPTPGPGCTFQHLEINSNGITQACFALYDACTGTEIASGTCGDGPSPPSTISIYVIGTPTITPGNTYYLQVAVDNAFIDDPFSICLRSSVICY